MPELRLVQRPLLSLAQRQQAERKKPVTARCTIEKLGRVEKHKELFRWTALRLRREKELRRTLKEMDASRKCVAEIQNARRKRKRRKKKARRQSGERLNAETRTIRMVLEGAPKEGTRLFEVDELILV